MIGTEPRPKEMAEQADWDERSSAGYYLLSQSLELNQRHHIMHLLPETDCGPRAWAVLKDLHAPTSVAASLMLDRELSMLRLSENEPVQPVPDKMRELYAKLAIAGITYPEQTKCLKMLSLLPESWLQIISGLSLPQNQSQWTLEWIRTKILEEDFRCYTLRGGDDSTSGYAMQGTWRDRGRGNRGRSYYNQGGRGTWNQRGRGGAGARGRVRSASGHAVKVAGVGRAAFRAPDGGLVVLKDVLLVPGLKQLYKEEAVKGLKLSGQPNDTKCETCLLSKFIRFPFHGVAGKSKAALELVHMDLSSTLRVLLAVAAVRKWKVKQMDIVTVFLYGIVEEEAPRCWYNRLASALEGIGFRASACDESLFLMGEGESLVLLLVYVDDILLFSSSDKEIDGVHRKLTEQFKCKSLGEARQLKEKKLRVKTRGNSNPWSGAYSTLLCILGLTSALLWDSWLQ
ncbi:hypothetical protein CLOM_g18088 [Closterium sp. NIES-68]|nr:hypothetical protein CLOM_g18088 [Closterium sp. NIES-68]